MSMKLFQKSKLRWLGEEALMLNKGRCYIFSMKKELSLVISKCSEAAFEITVSG